MTHVKQVVLVVIAALALTLSTTAPALADQNPSKVRVIKSGKRPLGVEISSDGHWLYVLHLAENYLAVINAETGQLVKRVQLPVQPNDTLYNPAGKLLFGLSTPVYNAARQEVYVAADKTLFVIDASTNEYSTKIKLNMDALAYKSSLSRDGSTLYLPSKTEEGSGLIIDLVKREIVNQWELPPPNDNDTPNVIFSSVLSPDESQLYVTTASGYVYSIDTVDPTVTRTYPVAPDSNVLNGLAITSDGKELLLPTPKELTVLSTADGSMRSIPLPGGTVTGIDVVVSKGGKFAYTTATDDRTHTGFCLKLDLKQNRVVDLVQIPNIEGLLQTMAINPIKNIVYVGSYDGDSIFAVDELCMKRSVRNAPLSAAHLRC